MDGLGIVGGLRAADYKIRAYRRLQLAISLFKMEMEPMSPLNPEVQAALDNVSSAIDAETTEIASTVQGYIDQINSGVDPTELVTSLEQLKTRIEGISSALPTPPDTGGTGAGGQPEP